MRDARSELWSLINDFEDFLTGGYRRKHEGVPAISRSSTGKPVRDRAGALASVTDEIARCDKCGLCAGRTKTVPGTGVLDPLVMFIGEGPGADEDRTGLPFVGKAGQYLDKWLAAIGLDRKTNSFIGNVVKCRPPGNRDPEGSETEACLPYLYRQIEIIRPKTIMTLGRIASQIMCGTHDPLGRIRGGRYNYLGIPVIPTYHPSGVLRNPEYRAPVWDDLKRLKEAIEMRSAGDE